MSSLDNAVLKAVVPILFGVPPHDTGSGSGSGSGSGIGSGYGTGSGLDITTTGDTK